MHLLRKSITGDLTERRMRTRSTFSAFPFFFLNYILSLCLIAFTTTTAFTSSAFSPHLRFMWMASPFFFRCTTVLICPPHDVSGTSYPMLPPSSLPCAPKFILLALRSHFPVCLRLHITLVNNFLFLLFFICYPLVESPSLEIFKTRLDVVLCSLVWVTHRGPCQPRPFCDFVIL